MGEIQNWKESDTVKKIKLLDPFLQSLFLDLDDQQHFSEQLCLSEIVQVISVGALAIPLMAKKTYFWELVGIFDG